MMLWFLTVFISILLCTADTSTSRVRTYSLVYDGLVSQDVVESYKPATGQDDSMVPYDMVTALSKDIAEDIIQSTINSSSKGIKSELRGEDWHLEMDRRCYQSFVRGGRCTIDHIRPDEVDIQISFQFAMDPNQSITLKVDAFLATPSPTFSRDILVRSIPIINDHINVKEDVIWSIREREAPVLGKTGKETSSEMGSHQTRMDMRQASVSSMILERPDLKRRTRLASLYRREGGSNRALEVWNYLSPESKDPIRALFVNGTLHSTTHHAGKAHAEALVHPIMNSIQVNQDDESDLRYPERIAIVSLEPTAVLREVLKHKHVKSVVLLGTDHEALELSTKFLSDNNDCSFLARQNTWCLSQPEVEFVSGDVELWFDQVLAGEANVSAVDALFVDVPSDNESWLDKEFQSKVLRILHPDSAAVFAAGSTPIFSDRYDEEQYSLNGRDTFLRETNKGFQDMSMDVYVYDEPLAAPLRSSFICIFTFEDDGYTSTAINFLRTDVAAIEIEMVNRLHAVPGAPITVVYDGPTHASYQMPSKAWQHWYCNSPVGKLSHICSTFFKDWYDPAKHVYKTEVRKHSVKGRSLHALEAVSAGSFILPDDAATQLNIDSHKWEQLNKFIEMFPDAVMYQQLKDFIIAYGFESEVLGQTGWGVSLANNSTFTNHACTEEEENVGFIEEIFDNEGHEDFSFSPAEVRYGPLVSILAVAARDIEAGEELQMNYDHFRSYPKDDVHLGLMADMCNSGAGLVVDATDIA